MSPDQTEGIDRRPDMSNEIYPLGEYTSDSVGKTFKKRRSVNQRLAPIFKALADDPEGWEIEQRIQKHGASWEPTDYSALQAFLLNPDGVHIRLTPKRKTISAEIPAPEMCSTHGVFSVLINYATQKDADRALEAIRSAMEGK